MKKYLLLFFLLATLPANAAVRRLTECTMPGGTPSEATPFELDACPLVNGDDITELLKDIGNQWSAIYVRAPSKTITVNSDTLHWRTAVAGKKIKTFVFLEDQDSINKLTIQHTPSNPTGEFPLPFSCVACDTTQTYCPGGSNPYPDTPGGFWDKPQRKTVMWAFGASGASIDGAYQDGYTYIKIGGPNLSMTFVGTHPGLGNAGTRRCGGKPAYATNEVNTGLLDFRVQDGTTPTLVDVRANTRNSETNALYFGGAQSLGGTGSRTTQVNLAGVHWNTTGIGINGGIKNLWYDPDRTVVSDPYNRNYGWDGTIKATVGGRQLGCYDVTRGTNGRSGASPQFVDNLTGGITLEWGSVGFVMRAMGTVGSAAAPFIVRLKDYGSSGPDTGYPAGVMVKKSAQNIIFKGDPHPALGNSVPFRFIRWISLPSQYGQGVHGEPLAACGGPDAVDNPIRLEANDNVGENALWDFTFQGDWTTQWTRGQLMYLAYEPWNVNDRSWGHVLRAASGMTFTDPINLHDTDTATGAGTFSNLTVAPVNIYQTSTPIAPKANKVLATNVTGSIAISASAGTTTITNVNFSGAARPIITIGSGSTAVVSQLCAPAGSTITGAGTLTYNGSGTALPFTISSAATACSIPVDPVPGAPTAGMH